MPDDERAPMRSAMASRAAARIRDMHDLEGRRGGRGSGVQGATPGRADHPDSMPHLLRFSGQLGLKHT